jgi:hypothetical protein
MPWGHRRLGERQRLAEHKRLGERQIYGERRRIGLRKLRKMVCE